MGAERNKAMLFEPYEAAVAKEPDAISNLHSTDFVEHSPQVADESRDKPGKRAFLDRFTGEGAPFDDPEVDIRRMIADDEHIFHHRLTNEEYPRGMAAVDIRRAPTRIEIRIVGDPHAHTPSLPRLYGRHPHFPPIGLRLCRIMSLEAISDRNAVLYRLYDLPDGLLDVRERGHDHLPALRPSGHVGEGVPGGVHPRRR